SGRTHGSLAPAGPQVGNTAACVPQQGYGNVAAVLHLHNTAAVQPVAMAPRHQPYNMAPSYTTRNEMAIQPQLLQPAQDYRQVVRQHDICATAPDEYDKKSPHTGSNMLRQLQRQLQQHVQRQQQQHQQQHQQQQQLSLQLPPQFQHQQQLQLTSNNHILTKRNSAPPAAEARGGGEATKRRRRGRRGQNPTATERGGRGPSSPRGELQ
ncbi:hypothetical protein Vretifemale_663, partial [Volvox reticuliferus]